MREILAQTHYLLRKDDATFRLNTYFNKAKNRYEVQLLMGRKEFEEIYLFTNFDLMNKNYCQFFYDNWYKQIKTNLKLNERLWR